MENSNICRQRQPTNNLGETTCPANGILNHNQEDSTSSWTRYRPRGSLARALHEKVLQDQYLKNLDKNEWYQCDLDAVSPELRLKFVQLGPDEDTLKFIDEAEEKSDWIFTQIWHMLVKLVLGWFMTQTSINGTHKQEGKQLPTTKEILYYLDGCQVQCSQDNKPQQLLPIQGDSFEEQVQSIVDDILKPAKFELVSWSRVPYLCEGDLRQSYYWLDDAIFIIRPI
ncbi:unnamed protein product [Ceutorhynchus assimilis]|uniref:Uncharacterized protein n=1 Tax=Ceutorhynchus assimilis TaxID=467358 RepID=A0A9N9MSJ7_9CUCU|nr:unnamed protein product [Ceutorhynchus assimilis]